MKTAHRLWSHFSLFQYFDTVAALWLCVAVQSDWSVRLKLSVAHCAQGAYSLLGGSHRICSLITAAVTQHTGLIPDRQISMTATLSRTSLLQASLCHCWYRPMSLRGNVAWIKISQSAVLHDMTVPPRVWLRAGGDGGGTVGLNSWMYNSS